MHFQWDTCAGLPREHRTFYVQSVKTQQQVQLFHIDFASLCQALHRTQQAPCLEPLNLEKTGWD